MKILTLDLEYNNNKQILSSGCIYSNLFDIQKIDEKFYKNKTDERTYKIHGLSNDFLSKYGKEKCILKHILKEQDYLVGFSIVSDFKVLGLKNPEHLYRYEKVIDIQLILNLFGVHMSLSSLLQKTNLLEQYKMLFPIHTSIMDSFLCFIFLEYLVAYIKEHTQKSTESILENLAKLTKYKYNKEFWLYEKEVEKMDYLYILLKEIQDIQIEEISNEPKYKKYINENLEVYNESFYIIGKYKKFKQNLNLKKLNFFKQNLNVGYKEIING